METKREVDKKKNMLSKITIILLHRMCLLFKFDAFTISIKLKMKNGMSQITTPYFSGWFNGLLITMTEMHFDRTIVQRS